VRFLTRFHHLQRRYSGESSPNTSAFRLATETYCSRAFRWTSISYAQRPSTPVAARRRVARRRVDHGKTDSGPAQCGLPGLDAARQTARRLRRSGAVRGPRNPNAMPTRSRVPRALPPCRRLPSATPSPAPSAPASARRRSSSERAVSPRPPAAAALSALLAP
jgi:hypothetical protein